MIETRNDLSFLNDTEINYEVNNMLTPSDVSKLILNGDSFKIKVLQTKDKRNLIVNDRILKDLKIKNMSLKNISTNDIKKIAKYQKDEYKELSKLLSDIKGNVTLYIEVLNNSFKNSLEKEIINYVNKNNIQVLVGSGNKKVIKYFRKKAPSIIRGIIYRSLDDDNVGFFEKNRIKKVKIFAGTKPDFIDYDINNLNENTIELIRTKKCFILTNLVDTDAKLKKAKMFANGYTVKNNYFDREEN